MEMLFTVEQVAERLQLSPLTVQRQLKRGVLRGIKKGRQWRVPESAIVENSEIAPRVPEAEAIWQGMTSGDGDRHNAAIVALSKAPQTVRNVVLERSTQALASYYQSAEGQGELADWRAIDGDPFADDSAPDDGEEEDAV